MSDFSTIHSFLVHFTVALFITCVLFDFWGIIRKDSRFHFVATSNLFLAALATLLSMASGILSKPQIQISENISHKLDLHQNLAFLIVFIVLSLTLWRIGLKGKFPENRTGYYLILGFIGIIILIIGAFFGGEIAHSRGMKLN
jgi:uncharacterized membrane protein